MKQIKILDTSVIIAFLNELNYPEGLAKLSKYYETVIPKGVASEITEPSQKVIL